MACLKLDAHTSLCPSPWRQNQEDHRPAGPDSHYARKQKEKEVQRDILLALGSCIASVFSRNQNEFIKKIQLQPGRLLLTLGRNSQMESAQNKTCAPVWVLPVHFRPVALSGPDRAAHVWEHRIEGHSQRWLLSHGPHTPLTAVLSNRRSPLQLIAFLSRIHRVHHLRAHVLVGPLFQLHGLSPGRTSCTPSLCGSSGLQPEHCSCPAPTPGCLTKTTTRLRCLLGPSGSPLGRPSEAGLQLRGKPEEA